MAATPKATQTLSISTSSAEFSDVLVSGINYVLTADADCFFRVSTTSDTATVSDMPLWANQYLEVKGDDSGELYIQVITASGTGTAYLTQIQ